MGFSSSFFLISPLPSHFQKFTFFRKIPLVSLKNSFHVLCCSSPGIPPFTQQDILNFIAESRGKTLPCVRTYENDLVRLSLVGDVAFDQAITAAAADGGKVAAEHLDSGVPAMVVETVFPGLSDPHATVSTRLFLPAREVKEKANKLKKSLSEDIFSETISRNILAMTFRQVVLQQLSNFELVLFPPGTERDMEDIESPREVPASFTLSSSSEEVISLIAEVVCISALQSTERHFLDNSLGRTSSNFFQWFKKHRRIVSKDSSIFIYQLFEDEIIGNGKSLLENFNSLKGTFRPKVKPKSHWWKPSAYFQLESIGGSEFASWLIEYIPAYRLEIDTNRLKNVKFEGWRKSAENLWEVLLTHSQMVRLVDALDMYFEDIYSIPTKELPCEVAANYVNLSTMKKGSSLLKILYATIASGIILLAICSLGQFSLRYQSKGNKSLRESCSLTSSEIKSETHQSSGTAEF
ncbi:uncharacterized protein LOC110821927 isoform X3 [Carica papaya]|uniref:uncharacterized protein LOC110821927 isoform X3 n=1 Tax=Carica papaya TaxID=3649 RepID=UPI000B8CEA02|nr:uncharacterized protein LOC110821927 isoform X3 [Carica papaya]